MTRGESFLNEGVAVDGGSAPGMLYHFNEFAKFWNGAYTSTENGTTITFTKCQMADYWILGLKPYTPSLFSFLQSICAYGNSLF